MVRLTRRLLLDIVVVGGTVAGSALVASAVGGKIAIIGYILLLISAIGSVILLRITVGAKSMVLINWYFIVVNIIGIIQFSLKG